MREGGEGGVVWSEGRRRGEEWYGVREGGEGRSGME